MIERFLRLFLASGILCVCVIGVDDDEFGPILGEVVDILDDSELFPVVVKGVEHIIPEKTVDPASLNLTSFRMSARKLHSENIDPWNGLPDPYVTVSTRSNSNVTEWIPVITTKSLFDNSDPDWPEQLAIRLIPGVGQKWKFDIFDYDPVGSDDFIGQVIMPTEDLINMAGDSTSRAVRPKGSGIFIIYRYEEFKKQIFL